MKMKTRAQQRKEEARGVMTSSGMECHLRNLVREILSGDTSKLVDFQQSVQYAPPAMKQRISDLVERIDADVSKPKDTGADPHRSVERPLRVRMALILTLRSPRCCSS